MQGFIGFILMVMGIVGASSPYTAWYLSLGWKLKDAEPSDAALVMHRIGGVVAAIFGLIVMLSSCSFGGGSSKGITSDFQSKLTTQEVREITVGWGLSAHALAEDDEKRALELMSKADTTKYELGGSYGYSGEAEIVFEDGTRSELMLFGPSGGVAWIVNDKAYKFESPELESLFRSELNRE